ncbi:MAG: YraN family protein [Patescibacteria group bacterium]
MEPGGRAQLGIAAELAAAQYLQQLGYRVRHRRWHCREGELDLVLYNPAERQVVFVEVKARRTHTYGSPAESIGPRKQRALEAAIERYLAATRCRSRYRVDVVTVDGLTLRVAEHLRNVRFG